MPKNPINARYGVFERLNRNASGTRFLDWNVVDTELGVMVEPRTLVRFIDGSVTQIDALDAAFTSDMQINRDTFYSQYNTDGPQLPIDITV